MILSIRSEVSYAIPNAPCTFVFNVEAAHDGAQFIRSEVLSFSPHSLPDRYASEDVGNRYARCHLANPGFLTVAYEAAVSIGHVTAMAPSIFEVSPGQIPLSVLPYTYPSRYCQSDRLLRMAHIEFGNLCPGFGRVLAICDWITERVEYRSGSTDSQTSAFDTATKLHGVCRDFAHLGITFCRALNIPARFVSVYALGLVPQDFHAVFEAYLGGRWWLFDPTRLVPLDSIVRIGTGKDAAEVSVATIWGDAQLTGQSVTVERTDGQRSAWEGGPVSLTPPPPAN